MWTVHKPARSIRTMSCRSPEGLRLLAGLFVAVSAGVAVSGESQLDHRLGIIRTAAERINLASGELKALMSAVASEPEEDFWALQIGDRVITASAAEVLTSAPALRPKAREAASRRAAFQAMLAALLPDLRALLDSLDCVNPSAQRRALPHAVSAEQVHGIVESGSVSTTMVEGDLAVGVLAVPRERVRLILPAGGVQGRERLLRAYQDGLRDEALRLMAKSSFEGALAAWHELSRMVPLSSDELISVARCFAEEGKPDEVKALIITLLRDSTLTAEQLVRSGDVAFSAKDESLATNCYEKSSAMIESSDPGALNLVPRE